MLRLIFEYPVESMATFATVLPFSVMLRTKAYNQPVEKWFFFYLTCKLVIELVMFYMASKQINNLALYNTHILISFCLLAKMSYEAVEIESHKNLITAASAAFVVFFCVDFIDVGFDQVVKVSATMQCLLMIVFCVLYFYGLLQSLKVLYVFEYPLFWIFSGVLIYYCSSTFATPIYNVVERFDAPRSLYVIVLIPYVCESIFLIMVALGLMLRK